MKCQKVEGYNFIRQKMMKFQKVGGLQFHKIEHDEISESGGL